MDESYLGRCLIGELFDKHILEDEFRELVDVEREGIQYQVQAMKSCFQSFGEKLYTLSGFFIMSGEPYRHHFRYDGPANKAFNDNYLVHTGSELLG